MSDEKFVFVITIPIDITKRNLKGGLRALETGSNLNYDAQRIFYDQNAENP